MTWLQDLVTVAHSNITDREREELMRRGCSESQIELFQIGHLNNDMPEGLPGMFTNWVQGKIDDVFVLPLTNTLGEVRGLQLRHVDREKSGYQDFFLPDKREACFFGLHQAITTMWESDTVYLVEGGFDLFPIHRGFPGVVATLTARVSPQLARVLKRVCNRVVLGYDNDDTGRRGSELFKKYYGSLFEVYMVEYPKIPGVKIKDPGDLWEAWGDDKVVPFVRSIVSSTWSQFQLEI